MLTPAWILDMFAGGMLAVAGVSAARLAGARPWQRGAVVTDTDVAHLLMAIAMAGMLAGGLRTLPNAAWVAIFGVLACWFGYRVVRDYRRQRRPGAGGRALRAAPGAQRGDGLHVPRCYDASGGHGGNGGHELGGAGAHVPTLAFVFALILTAYTIWDLDQLSGRRYRLTCGAVTVGCRIAMSVTMAFMLLIMI